MRTKQSALIGADQYYLDYLQSLRKESPEVVAAWVGQHLTLLEEIVQEGETGKSGIAEKDLRVRLHVARKTAVKWREVLAGTRDYVHINWYFLSDYETRLRGRKNGDKS